MADAESLDMKTIMSIGVLALMSFCAVMIGPMQLVRMCSSKLAKVLYTVILIRWMNSLRRHALHVCCTLDIIVSQKKQLLVRVVLTFG